VARGYVVVEGQGETAAVLNLLSRLWQDLELRELHWARPIRGSGLHRKDGVLKYCERVRATGDAAALLIVRDEDDACPAETAPRAAAWLRDAQLPFPVSIVLAHREYESIYLPCLTEMAGVKLRDPNSGMERPGLRPDAVFQGDPQAIRGVKEWLSDHMSEGRRYKPSVDQLPLTRLVRFDLLRASRLPWFGTLERALTFLAGSLGRPGVYPEPRSIPE
jgi:hypothetical protein